MPESERYRYQTRRMCKAAVRRLARRQWQMDESVFQVFNRAYGPANLDARCGHRHPREVKYCERVANLDHYETHPTDVM